MDFLHKTLTSNRMKLITEYQERFRAPAASNANSPTAAVSSPKNSVRFFNDVRVILIPTKEEYVDAGIHEQIWYSEEDAVDFKTDAVEEIRTYMAIKGLTAQQAVKQIYQDDDYCNSCSP